MLSIIKSFLNDERGLTAVEYAVCAALVSAVLVASFALLGTTIDGVIQGLIAAL